MISWQLEITTGGSAGNVPVSVDEDDLTGPLSTGNNDVQSGDDLPVNGSPSVTGTLAFSVGADEPADITFVAMHGQQVTGTYSDNSTGQIASQGRPLYYFYDNATHTLYATWVAPADFGTGDPANNAAFSVHITNPATGAYSFTLLDQLDHLPNGGSEQPPSDDLPSLRVSLDQKSEGGAFEDNIRLNITYTVTDDDGDEVSGTVSFDVDDDVPVQVDDTIVLGRVDEDELPDGITDDDAFTTVATGSLASLVSVGADEDGTFTIGSTGGLPQNLTSQGAPIVYAVNGNTITGYVDTGLPRDWMTATARSSPCRSRATAISPSRCWIRSIICRTARQTMTIRRLRSISRRRSSSPTSTSTPSRSTAASRSSSKTTFRRSERT